MKKITLLVALSLSLSLLTNACHKPKPACGNTKQVVKKKTKTLKKNSHFNMM
jgi:hypothetical protein